MCVCVCVCAQAPTSMQDSFRVEHPKALAVSSFFIIFDHPTAYGVPGPAIRSKPLLQLQQCRLLFDFFFSSLGLHPWHMGVPRLGVELEL